MSSSRYLFTIAVSPSGKYIFGGGHSTTLNHYSTDYGTSFSTVAASYSKLVCAIADDGYVIATHPTGSIVTLNIGNTVKSETLLLTTLSSTTTSISLSTTGDKWAIVNDDGVRVSTDRTTSILLTDRKDFTQIHYGVSTLWARSNAGIFTSTDSGVSWTILYSNTNIRTFVVSVDEKVLHILLQSGDYYRIIISVSPSNKLLPGYKIISNGSTTNFLLTYTKISPVSITVPPGLWSINYTWKMNITLAEDETLTTPLFVSYGLSNQLETYEYSFKKHSYKILFDAGSNETYNDTVIIYLAKQTTIYLNASLDIFNPNVSISNQMTNSSISATLISY
jgi:hypothetical protein